MDALIKQLDDIFVKKAPFQLPDEFKEGLVKYGPWAIIVVLVFSLPGLLVLLFGTAFVLPFSGLAGPTVAGGLAFAWVGLLAWIVLSVMALPGLFARKKSGWNLMFYSLLFSLVYSVLSFNLIGLVLTALIGGYLLMQVRAKYS